MKADLILAGGRIRTLGRAGLRAATHLAVAAGRVQAVGGADVMGLGGSRTRVVRLHGATVLPGFDDAHAHVVYYGLTRFGADLGGVRSIDDLLRRLRIHGRLLHPGEWQQGMGYRSVELVERRPPHRLELDRATGSRPAFIDERGGHARIANTAALAAASVTSATADPHGGRIGRDPDGTPNGLLLESAMRLVADVQPPLDRERRVKAILLAQRLLLSRGVTSVGAAVNRGFAEDLLLLSNAGRERAPEDARLDEFLSWELLDAAVGLGVRSGFGGSVVRAGPIKVFVDGGAERVAMRGERGLWRTTPDELRELVGRANAAGLQVAAHAIGDAAIEAMCDAVDAAGGGARRHRVEHCTICPPDLRARLARLGMVAVMQPLAARVARDAPGLFPARERSDLAAHRPLLRGRVHVAFSSDLPVTPDPNPWMGIQAAVDDPVNGIDLLQALRAYTVGGAFAAFEERLKGTLDPGMLADLQIFERDPLQTASESWDGLRPQAVLLGGVLVSGRL